MWSGNIFKKLFGKKDQQSHAESWRIFQGNFNGQMSILRLNCACATQKRRYSYHVGVVLLIGEDSDWSDPKLDELEDQIADYISNKGKSLFVSSLINCQMKELDFYCADPEPLIAAHKSGHFVQSKRFQMQLIIEPDQDWQFWDTITDITSNMEQVAQ